MFSFKNSKSTKILELEANSMFFLEILKGRSKNKLYKPKHEVEEKLPINTTSYTPYPVTGKKKRWLVPFLRQRLLPSLDIFCFSPLTTCAAKP